MWHSHLIIVAVRLGNTKYIHVTNAVLPDVAGARVRVMIGQRCRGMWLAASCGRRACVVRGMFMLLVGRDRRASCAVWLGRRYVLAAARRRARRGCVIGWYGGGCVCAVPPSAWTRHGRAGLARCLPRRGAVSFCHRSLMD